MLKIRLQRTGKINDASYRLVVVEHARSTKTGKIVERVGTYSPHTKVKNFNNERITYWMSKGAQASDTVHNMFVSSGLVKGKKINVLPKKTVPKKEEPAKEVVVSPATEAVKGGEDAVETVTAKQE